MDSCSKMNSQVEQIGRNLKDDWCFLEKIYDLLHEGNCLYVGGDEKIVDFKQPDEVMKLVNIKFSEESTCNQQELLEEFRKVIKYSVKTNHPHFHNQLFGQMDPIGLAGAWITEALNTSSYTFEVAPVFSLVESEVLRKVCSMCGYEQGDGIFAPGGSMSNMYGLSLARYKLCPDVKTKGIFGMKPLVLFTSEESHYSFKKNAHWLGIGTDNCIVVKVNDKGQMLASDLEEKIRRSLREDKQPFFVNATAGSTVLGAFDDLNAIADVCEKYDLWLHVDAAHGGSVILAKQNRQLLSGIQRTNSLAWNPHKTLGTPLQCSIFVTKDKDLLPHCNSTDAKYLFQQDKFYDVSYDTGNKSVQCGRKIDAFKLWSMLKYRGTGGLGDLVDHVITMSKLFTAKVKSRDGFRLVLDTPQYTNVCFWYIPKHMRAKPENDEWRQELWTVAPKIKEQMVRSGSIMVGYSPLPYRGLGNFLRMVFTCFPVLQEVDLDFILDTIEELGELAFNNNSCTSTSTSNCFRKNGYH